MGRRNRRIFFLMPGQILKKICPGVQPDQIYLFLLGEEIQSNIYWIEFQPVQAQQELQSKICLKNETRIIDLNTIGICLLRTGPG